MINRSQTWNTTLCPDNKSCAANCVLDGADYSATYGATTSGNALSLKFVTQSSTKNIGSRLYLMESATKYKLFTLENNEFSFDVDLSKLPVSILWLAFLWECELNRNDSAASTVRCTSSPWMPMVVWPNTRPTPPELSMVPDTATRSALVTSSSSTEWYVPKIRPLNGSNSR